LGTINYPLFYSQSVPGGQVTPFLTMLFQHHQSGISLSVVGETFQPGVWSSVCEAKASKPPGKRNSKRLVSPATDYKRLWLGKQIAQSDAGHGLVLGVLQLRQSFFKGPDGPASFFRQFFQGFAGIIERADVAHFNERFVVNFFQPAQRQTLRAANVRSRFVNAAHARVVQKGAGARIVRRGLPQQSGVAGLDITGFDGVNREAINATGTAATPAL
jgi:hypothetical protein